MDRLLAVAAGLLVLVLAAPMLAHLAQAAVPALVSVLVLLGVVRLALPWHRRR